MHPVVFLIGIVVVFVAALTKANQAEPPKAEAAAAQASTSRSGTNPFLVVLAVLGAIVVAQWLGILPMVVAGVR